MVRILGILVGLGFCGVAAWSLLWGIVAFSREVDQFWLNGDLLISPREQVDFLRRMFSYDLPVARRHIDAVKTAMTMPAGTVVNASGEHPFPLAWPAGTIARLKTGNGTVAGERASWIVGEIEAIEPLLHEAGGGAEVTTAPP